MPMLVEGIEPLGVVVGAVNGEEPWENCVGLAGEQIDLPFLEEAEHLVDELQEN